MKLKQGDKVVVIAGKYKGKTGTVMRILVKTGKVLVEKINLRTKHIKKTATAAGQKITYEAPMDASNVMLLDPKQNKPTRIGYVVEKGKKYRIAKLSGTKLDDVFTKTKSADDESKETKPAKSKSKK